MHFTTAPTLPGSWLGHSLLIDGEAQRRELHDLSGERKADKANFALMGNLMSNRVVDTKKSHVNFFINAFFCVLVLQNLVIG